MKKSTRPHHRPASKRSQPVVAERVSVSSGRETTGSTSSPQASSRLPLPRETAGVERWRGKVALVTGASSGIGAAVAGSLADLGMKVALVGRNRDRLLATARVVQARGGTPLVVACDQRSIAANGRMLRAVLRAWTRVDVLVHCAAVRGGTSLLKTDWREIQDALDLNIAAALWCAKAVAAQMSRRGEGAIINVSSLAGHRTLPGMPPVYAATKHALRVLTEGLRAEIVQRRLPIKVALVSPGLVDTPWHRGPGGLAGSTSRGYPHAPLQASDVAEAVRYILTAPPHVQVSDVLLRSIEQPY